jgi:20S proteasome alpha/beta subunit
MTIMTTEKPVILRRLAAPFPPRQHRFVRFYDIQNPLVRRRFIPPRLPKLKRKAPMTVLVGIICPSAIVLATDTQFTDNAGVVSYGNKISKVEFKPGDEVLIAQAGLPPITKRIVEIMEEKAGGIVIKTPHDVIQVAEDAIRQLEKQSNKRQWNEGCYNGAAIMLAFYAMKKPCLYTLDIYGHGVAEGPIKNYATAGIGSTLADYLLAESAGAGFPKDVAAVTAIDVIRRVKDHQRGTCGGDTNVRIIEATYQSNWENGYIGTSLPIPQNVVNKTEKWLSEQGKRPNELRIQEWRSVINKFAHDEWQTHLKKVEAEQKAEDQAEDDGGQIPLEAKSALP